MAQKNVTVPGVPAVKRVIAHVSQPSAHPKPVLDTLIAGHYVATQRIQQSPVFGSNVPEADGDHDGDFKANRSHPDPGA